MSSVESLANTNSWETRDGREINVSSIGRWASAIGGGALAVYGLNRRSPSGLLLTLLGSGLIYRGVTGHCEIADALHNRKKSHEEVAQDVHIETEKTINRPTEELFSFWRNFENLPRFIEHLESVTVVDELLSHWVAKGPVGEQVQWDAEIYNEKENELIAWRSLPGSDVVHAGTVRFDPTPDGRGTIVSVTMNYNVPGGKLTAALARLIGQAPEQLMDADLERLRELLESGEIAHLPSDDSGIFDSGKTSSKAAGGTLMGRTHSQLGLER